MAQLTIDNPYTLEIAVERPLARDAEVDRVLDDAVAAARLLAASPMTHRQRLCADAVAFMEQHTDRIADDITRMMGKPLTQARKEVAGMAGRARHVIDIAGAALADTELPGKAGFTRRIQRVPLGVVFNLPAWNYPLLTCVNVVVPAVLAGNAVVLKHSSRTALCGEHFAEAFAAAGAAPGVLTALHCDHATAGRIAADRRVGYVGFTGSVAGGRAVYRSVGEGSFAEVGLELGGKDAAYVAADAALDEAVAGTVDGACYNAGQSCCGVERIYVHRAVHDAFVERARAEVLALTLGDPRSAVSMGPMAQADAPAFLRAQVEQAQALGAELLAGGHATAVDGKGRFFEPTLLTGCTHDMDVMRVESFGPIVPVMVVDSDEEAVARINDSDLGLTASIWTSDDDRADRLASQLEVGTVYQNQCDTLDPALPWTGVKDSGKGSTLSALGLVQLTRPRSLNLRRRGS